MKNENVLLSHVSCVDKSVEEDREQLLNGKYFSQGQE